MKPNSLDDNIVFQCSDFSHTFSRLLTTELMDLHLDISPEQLSILAVLWYRRKATQGEISSQLRRDKSTIARVVHNMEGKGLLAFSPHPNDNRSRLASLTTRGESIQAAAIQASGALYVRAVKGIAATDIRVALKVLAVMIRNCAPILFLLLGLCPAYAQPVPQAKRLLSRRYQLGETYRYQLSCESYKNGQWTSTNISICRLTVVKDSSGTFCDEVTWESLKTLSPKDSIDVTQAALATKPYRISLEPQGHLDLPPLTDPAMTESITDFNTFFVAIAPKIGIGSLSQPGDSMVTPKPVIGNFANGKNILKGEDCLSISIKLSGYDDKIAHIVTSFLPPATSGLKYILPAMDTPVVAGVPNNFQMIMPAGPQKYFVQYGNENFVIRSTLSTADGKIIGADMDNQLTLKVRVNCDADCQHCVTEIPLKIQRRLTLKLL